MVIVTGYLAGKLQVVQQFAHCVGVQALHCGVSLESCFLDSTFHHCILDDGDDECVSFCQTAVQPFLKKETEKDKAVPERDGKDAFAPKMSMKKSVQYLLHVFQLFFHHTKVVVIV